MKRLLIIAFLALTTQTFAQTGWVQQRAKLANKDSTSFSKDANFLLPARFQQAFKIGATTITANGTEINILDGLLSSTAELNYLVGVTSNVQTQLNAKAPVSNPNFTTAARLSGDTLLTKTRGTAISTAISNDLINDSLEQRLTDALLLSDLAFMKADANTSNNAVTLEYMQNYTGGGSAFNIGILQFRVDSGAVETYISGDSSITQTFLVGKHVDLWRNGVRIYPKDKQYYVDDSFEHNTLTGQLTVHPPFQSDERIIIETTDNINWTTNYLIGSENDLLTGLRAYWGMDETSGTLVSDSHTGNFDGTTNAAVGGGLVAGMSRSFTRASSQYVSLGDVVGDVGTSDWSYQAWIYVPTLQSTDVGILGNWISAPYYYLGLTTGNSVVAAVDFGTGGRYVYSNSPISASNVTHIVVTHNRDGNMILYVNGVAQTDTDDISSFTATSMSNAQSFRIGNIGPSSSYYFDGRIDEVAIWLRVLSPAEVSELLSGEVGLEYPFTD